MRLLIGAGVSAALALAAVAVIGTSLLLPSIMGTGHTEPEPASALAVADIPAAALRDYQDAAQTCPGLSWTVLAGIGKVESDHGRSTLPGVHSGQNSAGARGPMQFLLNTWNAFHLPGLDNVYDLHDAAFAAAHYLCSNGAGLAAKLRQAIWQYNHAWWYVDEVLAHATRYAADATRTVIIAALRPGDPFAGTCRPVVTQGYGPTEQPGEPAVFGFAHFHTGIDLACVAGTPIHSLTDGIAHVTTGWGSGFGNNVVAEVQLQLPGDSSPQRYYLRYGHLLVLTVADGAVVHAGDILGLEGSTGYSTGPHLHFEVDRGAASVQNAVDPAPLLAVSS
ncbi:MAG TPA: peptidoglycan DD-metalloendopeptidase family protein [Candidatus Dormibacteraeota bacterium]|nr:peptidoglycan DD-metalloendopeptidase family protein [Candidatus Dormibacteraeota bacterium]